MDQAEVLRLTAVELSKLEPMEATQLLANFHQWRDQKRKRRFKLADWKRHNREQLRAHRGQKLVKGWEQLAPQHSTAPKPDPMHPMAEAMGLPRYGMTPELRAKLDQRLNSTPPNTKPIG